MSEIDTGLKASARKHKARLPQYMCRRLFTEKRTPFLHPSTPNVVQKNYEENREERLNFVKWRLQGVYDEFCEVVPSRGVR